MNTNDNFCSWTDANAFMRDCFTVDGVVAAGEYDYQTARRLESPLELVMFSAIRAAERSIKYQDEKVAYMVELLRKDRLFSYVLKAAVPIGTYRADLVMQAKFVADVLPPGSVQPSVVIECDGFTYHDKTRDQACRDRARDRYMQREGFIVARFAGDEIVEQPFACAFEVFDLVMRGIGRTQRDHHPENGWPVFTRGNEGNDSGPQSMESFILSPSLRGL